MSIKEDNFLTKAISKKISRRSFIKWSSALGATASMSGLVMQAGTKVAGASHDASAPWSVHSELTWKPSCCLVCHGWCSIAAGVDKDGHVRKIEGCGGQPKKYVTGEDLAIVGVGAAGAPTAKLMNEKADDANHIPTVAGYLPYAPHNKGRICAKGNDGVEHLYDPDRIKYPLKRAGIRGSGNWTRISWEAALGEIADVLRTMAQAGNQHRFVHWVGRNEHFSPKTFSKAYGTPNHIEHTSLCELSRHVAARTLWGHHWSSVDMQEHANISITTADYAGSMTLDRNLHDIDYYIEWGGNPAEAKIPHSSCANHLGDRRRSNLVGYTGGGRTTGTTLGRIACIDVRQSNTAAFADEYFQIIPGSDGALALWIIREVLRGAGVNNGDNADVVRQEIERGHNGGTGGYCDADGLNYDATGRFYFGLFQAEEAGGLASGGLDLATGKSLESYLFGQGTTAGESFAEHLTTPAVIVGNNDAEIKTAVQAVTGLGSGDLDHLAAVMADGVGGEFINVVIDGYRGPAKHTNGVYNYRAIRALQLLAPNYSADGFHGTSASLPSATSRGGYNAPGAFQSDKNWDPYGGKLGLLGGNGSNPKAGGSEAVPGVTSAIDAGLPDDEAVGGGEAAPSGKQRIDNWDYENDVTRWRASYKWVDQNAQCGIRHSIGLSEFTFQGGAANDLINGPYGNDAGTGYDENFIVEALMWHKNAPTYSRPGQNNEVEMMIAPGPTSTGYAIEHLWCIDLNMGDGSRFADIILPDVSYLERYAERSGEGQEFNFRDNTFFRLPVYEVDGATIDGEVIPQHMYDSKQVSAIYYELARTIENLGTSKVTTSLGTGASTFAVTDTAAVAVGQVAKITTDAANSPTGESLGTVVSFVLNTSITTSGPTTKDYGADGATTGSIQTGVASSAWAGDLYRSFTWTTTDAGSVAANSSGGTAYVNEGEWARQAHFEIQCNDLGGGSGRGCGDVAAVINPSLSGADYVRAHGMMWGTDDDPAYWRPSGFRGDGGEHVGDAILGHDGNSYVRDNGFKMSTMSQALQINNYVLGTTPDLVISGSPVATAATKSDGTFYGIPVYNPVFLQTSNSYPRHLTTYKVNVHCHARTACMPRLNEILGNSWAVLPVSGTDGGGPFNLADDGVTKIYNGGTVTIASEAGTLTCVAKVTEKAQANCVHISHHQGHKQGIYTIADDGNPWNDAYGVYKVDGAANRSQHTTLNNKAGGPMNAVANNLPPSAPGKGTHPNKIIVHHRSGATETGAEYATDPIGGSQGWFDTKVTVS